MQKNKNINKARIVKVLAVEVQLASWTRNHDNGKTQDVTYSFQAWTDFLTIVIVPKLFIFPVILSKSQNVSFNLRNYFVAVDVHLYLRLLYSSVFAHNLASWKKWRTESFPKTNLCSSI